MNKPVRLLVVLPMLALAACTPNIQPISIQQLSVVPEDCVMAGQGMVPFGGGLDTNTRVAATPRYWLGFTLKSELGQLVAPNNPRGNDVAMREAVVSYALEGATVALPGPETVPFAGVLASQGQLFGGVNVIGPQMAQALAGLVVPAGTQAILRVTFFLRGELRAGGMVQSDTISYPITLYTSSFAGCPVGDALTPAGACGNNAQDGAGGCCAANTTTCYQ